MGVHFVNDYLQLQFESADLHEYGSWAWPTVRTSEQDRRLGEPGYRDALCSFIGKSVARVDVYLDDGVVVAFDGGELIVTPEQIRTDETGEVIYGAGLWVISGEPPFD